MTTIKAIRETIPLSRYKQRGEDPIRVCNVCGEPPPAGGGMDLYRECDEYDRPIARPAALVYVAQNHRECRDRLDAHPRLYVEESGQPGTFPKLCGECVHRTRSRCDHPDLAANGGDGLKVTLTTHLPRDTIVCGRNGRVSPMRDAVLCEGRQLAADRGLQLGPGDGDQAHGD